MTHIPPRATAIPFERIVAAARQHSGMTAAEFDYSLAYGGSDLGTALAALGNALYDVATADTPVVQPGDGPDVVQRRHALADELGERHRADVAALVAAARAKSYTRVGPGPIRYA